MSVQDHRYSDSEARWRVPRERRDMRHFVPAAHAGPLPDGLIERLVLAGHLAASVGYMQPWRCIRVSDRALRRAMQEQVESEHQRTAAYGRRSGLSSAAGRTIDRPRLSPGTWSHRPPRPTVSPAGGQQL